MRQLIVLALLSCCMVVSPGLYAQEKPNMVIFLADDLNQQDIGVYGNKQVKTPHMDQLAAEGMRFTKAYAASPMCTPSRSALFTGLYPYRNGAQKINYLLFKQPLSLSHGIKFPPWRFRNRYRNRFRYNSTKS